MGVLQQRTDEEVTFAMQSTWNTKQTDHNLLVVNRFHLYSVVTASSVT